MSPEQERALKSLSWGLKERQSIKIAEDELAERKAKANMSVAVALTVLNLKTYMGPEGTLTLKDGGITRSLNKEKLVAGLLEAGLAADKVKQVMDKAIDEKTKKGSIEFTARKE